MKIYNKFYQNAREAYERVNSAMPSSENLEKKVFNYKRNLIIGGLSLWALLGFGAPVYGEQNIEPTVQREEITKERQPLCRQNAIVCGLKYREFYDNVQIAWGPMIGMDNVTHAQAKVNVNGEWKWLLIRRDFGECKFSNQDPFKEEASVSVEEVSSMLREGLKEDSSLYPTVRASTPTTLPPAPAK